MIKHIHSHLDYALDLCAKDIFVGVLLLVLFVIHDKKCGKFFSD